MTNLDKLEFIHQVIQDAIQIELRLTRCGSRLDSLHIASQYLDDFKQGEKEANNNEQ